MTGRPTNDEIAAAAGLTDLVVRVGDALYGLNAIHRLSEDLPMAKRTVERIYAYHRDGDDHPAAAKALNDLPRLIEEKRRELDELSREVFRAQMRR